MLTLGRYENGICECGFHESLTNDLSNGFTPEVKVCNVCKGLAKFVRVQAAEDERNLKSLGEKPDPLTPRPSDGRRTFTKLMSAAEVAARRVARAAK